MMTNINQSGRSMVEILGVLAIIGVLSVGGIAGYGKAMRKHKLTNYASQASYLFNGFIRYKNEFARISAPSRTMIDSKIISTLDIVPNKWNIKSNGYIYDDMSGYFEVFRLDDKVSTGAIVVNYKYNHKDSDVCTTFLTDVIKPMSYNIQFIQTSNYYFYGDQGCDNNCKRNSNRISLPTATISQIRDACELCDANSSCNLAFRII